MRYFTFLGVLGLILAGSAAAALAQFQGQYGGPPGQYGAPPGQYGAPPIQYGTPTAGQPGSAPQGQYRAPFQEQLQEIKRSQLGPTLGVDQATVDRLLQIEQRYRTLKNQVNQGAMADMQRLQQVMANPNPPEAEVRTILETMTKRMQESRSLQQREQEEETAVLTPVQQARYIMYKMQLLREARSVKQSPGTPGPIGPSKVPREVPVFRPQ